MTAPETALPAVIRRSLKREQGLLRTMLHILMLCCWPLPLIGYRCQPGPLSPATRPEAIGWYPEDRPSHVPAGSHELSHLHVIAREAFRPAQLLSQDARLMDATPYAPFVRRPHNTNDLGMPSHCCILHRVSGRTTPDFSGRCLLPA
ncbi:hypothetical protein F5Y14DRAFT_419083 [Nemania sp. NC0429]|nr:hypothetical protein F5Y14DRAFT_419083 [Nemania sp. NC0429]